MFEASMFTRARASSPAGVLSFYNAKTKQLMHTFKTKFQQPVIPAFMVRESAVQARSPSWRETAQP